MSDDCLWPVIATPGVEHQADDAIVRRRGQLTEAVQALGHALEVSGADVVAEVAGLFFESSLRAFRDLFIRAKERNEVQFALSLIPEFRGEQDVAVLDSRSADTPLEHATWWRSAAFSRSRRWRSARAERSRPSRAVSVGMAREGTRCTRRQISGTVWNDGPGSVAQAEPDRPERSQG